MPESSFSKPNFTVCYEPQNTLLRISWQGNVTEDELKTGYETVLNLLRESPVTRLLIDVSKRKTEPDLNPQLLFSNIFSEALRIIGNTIFLAIVVSQEEFFLTSVTSRFEHLKHSDNHFIVAEQFLSREDAEAWLAKVT